MNRFDTQNEKRLYVAEILSALLGVVISFYLLVQHTRLTNGIQEGASFCSFGKYADCDVVNGSRYSDLLGIPLGAWGASYFFLLLVLVLVAPPRDKNFRFFQGLLGWGLCAGLLVDVAYFIIQIAALKTLCIMCLLTYLANFLLLLFAAKLAPGTGSRLKTLLLEKASWNVPPLRSARNILAVVSWILFTLVILLVPAQLLKKSANYVHADQAIEQFMSQWKDRPIKKWDTNNGNGTWGNSNSKVVITEFSDFECPFCRKAAFTLHTVLKPFKDRVYFVFRNFPLDSTCNPALPYQIHAHACKLAKLSVCGQMKGKFWDVHDQLFLRMSDDDMKKGFDAISESLRSSFSEAEVSQCLQDPKVNGLVLEDIKLAQSLNIRGTPAVFINGKQITIPLTIDSLRRLIELEEKLVQATP